MEEVAYESECCEASKREILNSKRLAWIYLDAKPLYTGSAISRPGGIRIKRKGWESEGSEGQK